MWRRMAIYVSPGACLVLRHEVVVRSILECDYVIYRREPDIEATTTYHSGRTPLHYAALKGHEGVTKPLLVYTSDLNATDSYHSAPLHLAARLGHESIVQLLIDHGSSTETSDPNGWTPLMDAVELGHAGRYNPPGESCQRDRKMQRKRGRNTLCSRG